MCVSVRGVTVCVRSERFLFPLCRQYIRVEESCSRIWSFSSSIKSTTGKNVCHVDLVNNQTSDCSHQNLVSYPIHGKRLDCHAFFFTPCLLTFPTTAQHCDRKSTLIIKSHPPAVSFFPHHHQPEETQNISKQKIKIHKSDYSNNIH